MKRLIYDSDPSVAAYMLRALCPSRGFGHIEAVPPIVIERRRFVLDQDLCRTLALLCGLPASPAVPIFFPQVLGFRLVMRTVTDPDFPAAIWNALQVRNQISQLTPIMVGDQIDFRLETSSVRHLEKGVEVDLLLNVSRQNEVVWKSATTFYYRGPSQKTTTTNLRPPTLQTKSRTPVTLPIGGMFEYGKISGDYNGIHLWNSYARLLGFRASFLHPHRALGAIFACAPELTSRPINHLDVWFRGPAPYGQPAKVGFDINESETIFGLFVEEDRPCLVGSFRSELALED